MLEMEGKCDMGWERGIPRMWGKCYIVRCGNVYDEYDGTLIGDWRDFANGYGVDKVDLKICDAGGVVRYVPAIEEGYELADE